MSTTYNAELGIQMDDEDYDRWNDDQQRGGGGGDDSGGGDDQGEAWNERARQDPTFNPRDALIGRDRASWEAYLRAEAAAAGVEYDPSDLEGVERQVSYAQNAGRDPADFLREQAAIYNRRNDPTFSAGGRGGDLDTNDDAQLDPGWTDDWKWAGQGPRPDVRGVAPGQYHPSVQATISGMRGGAPSGGGGGVSWAGGSPNFNEKTGEYTGHGYMPLQTAGGYTSSSATGGAPAPYRTFDERFAEPTKPATQTAGGYTSSSATGGAPAPYRTFDERFVEPTRTASPTWGRTFSGSTAPSDLMERRGGTFAATAAPGDLMDRWSEPFSGPSRPTDLATAYGERFTGPSRDPRLSESVAERFTGPSRDPRLSREVAETFRGPQRDPALAGSVAERFSGPQRDDDLMAAWGREFSFDPTKITENPAYKVRLSDTIKAVERSAAAKGLSFTNQAREELMQRAGGLASEEIGNEFGRQVSTYGTNFDTFAGDRGRRATEANQRYFEAGDTADRNFGQRTTDLHRRSAEADRGYGEAADTADRNFGQRTTDLTRLGGEADRRFTEAGEIADRNFGQRTTDLTRLGGEADRRYFEAGDTSDRRFGQFTTDAERRGRDAETRYREAGDTSDRRFSQFSGDRIRRGDEAQRQFGRESDAYRLNFDTAESNATRRGGEVDRAFGRDLSTYGRNRADFETDRGFTSDEFGRDWDRGRTSFLDRAGIADRNEQNRYSTERSNLLDTRAWDDTLWGRARTDRDFTSAEFGRDWDRGRTSFLDRAGIADRNEQNRYSTERSNLLDTRAWDDTQYGRARTDRLDTRAWDDTLWGRARTDRNDEWGRGTDIWGMQRTDRNDELSENYRWAELPLKYRPGRP